MKTIDLNCDLGEGAGHDDELMPLVTSANIACGGHTGDAATMREAVALANRHGVAVGAHPGWADREGFGRTAMTADPAAVTRLVVKQIRALAAFGPLRHVKVHGALYDQAVRVPALAAAVAAAVHQADPSLMLFGPPGSALLRAGRSIGLRVAREAFADRTYEADGSLTPRRMAGAVIEDPETAVAQVLQILRDRWVRATDGTQVPLEADTICLHGDGSHAVALALRIRAAIEAAGFKIAAV